MFKRLTNLMTAVGNGSPCRITLAALVLFAVIVVAEKTQASCGDYLVVDGVNNSMDHSGEETSMVAARTPIRSPCHGPQCRQAPGSPIPPLPVQLGSAPNERAHLERMDEFNLTSPFWFRVVDAAMQLTPGFPFPLERPPQA